MIAESALLTLVPEAEDLIQNFRRQYDPAAAVGIPAHVTILYPFKPPHRLTDDVIAGLRELFAQSAGFQVSFGAVGRFPGVLYLAPEPAERFRQLTRQVMRHFPETPPYGGAHQEIIPHMTIAQHDDSRELDAIASAFDRATKGRLPLCASVQTVVLMENSSGVWRTYETFALGAPEL